MSKFSRETQAIAAVGGRRHGPVTLRTASYNTEHTQHSHTELMRNSESITASHSPVAAQQRTVSGHTEQDGLAGERRPAGSRLFPLWPLGGPSALPRSPRTSQGSVYQSQLSLKGRLLWETRMSAVWCRLLRGAVCMPCRSCSAHSPSLTTCCLKVTQVVMESCSESMNYESLR